MSYVNQFCVDIKPEVECQNPVFIGFPDELKIIANLLHYFKTYLPQILLTKKDCRNKQIVVGPDVVGIKIAKNIENYFVLLVPSEDSSEYEDDNFLRETFRYSFELQIIAKDRDFEGAIQNLVILKSALKTMLVNMPVNLGYRIEIDPFSYTDFNLSSENVISRGGVFPFTIIGDHFRS